MRLGQFDQRYEPLPDPETCQRWQNQSEYAPPLMPGRLQGLGDERKGTTCPEGIKEKNPRGSDVIIP